MAQKSLISGRIASDLERFPPLRGIKILFQQPAKRADQHEAKVNAAYTAAMAPTGSDAQIKKARAELEKRRKHKDQLSHAVKAVAGRKSRRSRPSKRRLKSGCKSSANSQERSLRL